MYKIVLAGLSAATISASIALAADLPSRKYEPAAPVVAAPDPDMSWTGGYVGVTAGAILSDNSDASVIATDIPFADPYAQFKAARKKDEAGFTGGVTAGYNYQVGTFVAGVEVDYNWSNSERQSHFDATLPAAVNVLGIPVTGNYHATGVVRSKLESHGSLRLRAGLLATPSLLIYATGGVATGNVKSNANFSADVDVAVAGFNLGTFDLGSIAARKTKTLWGWAIGGGVEYALAQNVSIKAEYLYVDLGEKNYTIANQAYDGFDASVKQKNQFHVVRAGVNYRF